MFTSMWTAWKRSEAASTMRRTSAALVTSPWTEMASPPLFERSSAVRLAPSASRSLMTRPAPAAREPLGHGPSHPPGGAGDDGYLTFELA